MLGMREAQARGGTVAPAGIPSAEAFGRPAVTVGDAPTEFEPIPFWRVVARRPLPAARPIRAAPFKLEDFANRSTEYPAPPSLARWSRIEPGLGAFVRSREERGRVDVRRLVKRWARFEPVRRLPRRLSRLPSSRIFVLVDRSRHLEPFWDDQDEVLAKLRSSVGAFRIHVEWWPHGVRPLADWKTEPCFADPVLALSDLGGYAGQRAVSQWRALGYRLRRLRVPRMALVPCPRERWRFVDMAGWNAIEWEAPQRPGASTRQSSGAPPQVQRDRLLTLVAPVLSLDPGLLRALRRLFPEAGFDAGTEYDVWWQRRAERDAPDPGVDRWREVVGDRGAAFAATLRRWREDGVPELAALEHLGIANDCQAPELVSDEDLHEARQLMLRVAAHVERSTQDDALLAELARWLVDVAPQSPGLFTDDVVGEPLRKALRKVQRQRPAHHAPPARAKNREDEDAQERGVPLDPGLAQWHAHQVGGDVRFMQGAPDDQPGSPLGSIAVGDELAIGARLSASGEAVRGPGAELVRALPSGDVAWWRTEPAEEVILRRLRRPSWAEAMGRDRFGLWVEFAVGEAKMRMRWIAPGTYRMGSPADEPGRREDEGPHHLVTLTEGFWLADTPCTQELWEGVTGRNPSRLVSPRRPVERVSWDEITEEFLPRLNERCPGLDATLPTEAQWEYACRAGTETATYAGPIEIVGERNAPMLEEIAWYGGNSGVGYELEDGHDSRDWEEKAHAHEKAGTRIVGEKRANPWGLFDMLGNVYEWCLDGRRGYVDQPSEDPLGPMEESSFRVVRGGSWDDSARYVRAAYRLGGHPSFAVEGVGFRLSRGQESGPARSRGAGPVRPPAGRRRRPAWASTKIQRDRFGQAVEVVVRDARMRLRWIEPGNFRMGSPDGEPGRFDREGPQHDVTLTRGFWLADTPCTQDLWEAVMGGNPSRFVSPRRPVEQVSWETVVQEFLPRLNELCPGLEATLPTEAQWEYACRAGTETATHAGPIEVVGENNAPVLEEIAWYGGNSGVGYELDEGLDSSGWEEKGHAHTRAGTREVGSKAPNPWGLHDMLGNVAEWCLDGMREFTDRPCWDPLGSIEGGSLRVVRGGSWGDRARGVRAAYRDKYEPSHAIEVVGFRLSRDQDS